jgi:hypothetical protein
MAERETTRIQQYNCGHNKQDTSLIPSVLPLASPPPEPSGGFTTFPNDALRIFASPQNTLSLAFNWLKLQPQNSQAWERLKRIFVMLAKERKEAKEALMEFLGFEDDVSDEVEICTKVLVMQRWFEKHFACFCEKPPPNKASDAWLSAVVPRLCRAPDTAALWRCVGG